MRLNLGLVQHHEGMDETERAWTDQRCAQVGPMELDCIVCCSLENISPELKLAIL